MTVALGKARLVLGPKDSRVPDGTPEAIDGGDEDANKEMV